MDSEGGNICLPLTMGVLTPASRCSYIKINQTQACQNSKLINGMLKEELDFQGFMLSNWATIIPPHVMLIKDKEPMRTLGAWVGNEITIEEKWNKILEKQENIMEVWAKSKPTYQGK